MNALLRYYDNLRPLDPVRSIKAKLGLLVIITVAATAFLLWYALAILGIRARYALPVVVIVGLVVTQILAHGMTAPLRQMTAAARRMAVGRPPGPIRATSRDEVGDLARAFTAMATEIAASEQQRRDIVANVSHELRTPVASLRAQLENMVDGVAPADPQRLGELLHQVEYLGELVDDLLDLARTEAGMTPLQRESLPLAAVARDVAAQIEAVRPDRNIMVNIAETVTVDADVIRLRQILLNLTDNASRHTPAGGRVWIEASVAAQVVDIRVRDEGPGIPEDQIGNVFKRFHQAAVPDRKDLAQRSAVADGPETGGDGAQRDAVMSAGTAADGSANASRNDGGTGLGLAIVQWAVTLHGGHVNVVPSDVGCHIQILLPGGKNE